MFGGAVACPINPSLRFELRICNHPPESRRVGANRRNAETGFQVELTNPLMVKIVEGR